MDSSRLFETIHVGFTIGQERLKEAIHLVSDRVVFRFLHELCNDEEILGNAISQLYGAFVCWL